MAERLFTDPHAAAQHVRDLMSQGATVSGSEAALRRVGVHPGHRDERLSKAESETLAQSKEEIEDTPTSSWRPKSSNPNRPRAIGAAYYPRTQRLEVQFRGGAAYYYYDVPPQVAEAFRRAPSAGKFIDSTLNNFEYGVVSDAHQEEL